MNYGLIKNIDFTFNDALLKIEEELKKEGFGILTKIDVKAKFKEKLNIEFPRYMILGACNPEMAHKSISVEWNIGLLLPCNVVVYEKEGTVWIGIIRPTQAMAGIENEELSAIAKVVEAKLEKVFDNI